MVWLHIWGAVGHLYIQWTYAMFLPEAQAVVAPPPEVDQLEAVVTATAEQLALVSTDVQRGHFPLSRKLLGTADGPA